MRPVYTKLVDYLREELRKLKNPVFDDMTVEQVSRIIFMNLRGRGPAMRGMRLSPQGFSLLGRFFKPYVIDLPEGYLLGSEDLLWLDSRAKMPYYVGRGDGVDGKTQLVVFDAKFGLQLKLADGMISTLREIESFRQRFSG